MSKLDHMSKQDHPPTAQAAICTGSPSSGHGLARPPLVDILDYNARLRDGDGFLGDRGSRRAFQIIVEQERARLRDLGLDPLGRPPTNQISKKALDAIMARGKPPAAGLVLGAVEKFAQELATITRHFLQAPGWRDVQRIAVGGGMRASRCGELAIGRAAGLLRTSGHPVDLRPVRHHPDAAGLVGAVQLMPPGALSGYDSLLAADIGGSNMRVGIVELNLKKAADFRRARVMGLDIWRHRDAQPSREEAVQRLCGMLRDLARRARKDRLHLAPFIGIGCPGGIAPDGAIEHGGQNLPGEWEDPEFNLPSRIRAAVPEIGGQPTSVMMHNDAVVQGLSEVPRMQDVRCWAILTIGTGLGNASFRNLAPSTDRASR